MKLQKKPFLPYAILGILLAFVGHRAYSLYRLAPTPDITNLFGQYDYILQHFFAPPYFYWNSSPLAILSALVGFFIGLLLYLRVKLDGNYRHGEESGSARFATAKELEGFQDKGSTII